MLATTPRRSLRIEKLHSTPKNDNRATDDKENNVNNNKSYSPSTSNNTEEDDSLSDSSDDKQAFNGVDVSTQTPIPKQNVMIKQEDQGEDCSDTGSCVNDFARCDGTDAKQEEENDDDDQSTGSFDNKRRTDDDLSTRSNGNDTVDSVDGEQAPNVTTVSTQTPIRNQTIHTVMIKQEVQEASIEITKEEEEDDDDDQSTGDSVSEKEVTNMSTQVNEVMLYSNNLVPVKVESNYSKLEKSVVDEDGPAGDVMPSSETNGDNSISNELNMMNISALTFPSFMGDGGDDGKSMSYNPQHGDDLNDTTQADLSSGSMMGCSNHRSNSTFYLPSPVQSGCGTNDVEGNPLAKSVNKEGDEESETNITSDANDSFNTNDLFGSSLGDSGYLDDLSGVASKVGQDSSSADLQDQLKLIKQSRLITSLEFDKVHAQRQASHNDTLRKAAEAECARLWAQLNARQSQLNASNDNNAVLVAENSRLKEENTVLNVKVETSKADTELLKEKLSFVKVELENTRKDLSAVKKERNDLAASSDESTNKVNNLEYQLKLSHAEVDKLNDYVGNLESENATLKDELASFEEKLISEQEEKSNLVDEANELNVDLNVLAEEVDTSQITIAAQNREKASLVEEKTSLEKRVDTLEKSNSSLVSATTELRGHLSTSTNEIASLKELNGMLQEEGEDIMKKLDAVKHDRDNLADSLDETKCQCKQFESSLEETTSVNASLKNELDNVNVNNKNLSEEVKSLKDIVEVLTSNNTRLNEESNATIVSLENDKSSLTEENSSLYERVDTLEEEKLDFVAANERLYDQANKLSCQKKDLKSKLHDAQLHIKELENEIAQKDIDIDKTTIQLEQVKEVLQEEVMEKHKLKKEADLREQSLLKSVKRFQKDQSW